jgi:hypothetical protein
MAFLKSPDSLTHPVFLLFISGHTECLSRDHVRADVCNSNCLVLRLKSVMYLKTVTEQQRMKLDAGENYHENSSVVIAIIL